MENVIYKPIGIVHSEFKSAVGVPIQSSLSNKTGKIEVYREYLDGLKDLEEFSHIILVYHLHQSSGYSLKVKPFLDDKEHGIFATRSPKRPNAIGLSVLEMVGIDGNILNVNRIDIVEGTPVLDIKPYVRKFDVWDNKKEGWFTEKVKGLTEHYSDDRFSS